MKITTHLFTTTNVRSTSVAPPEKHKATQPAQETPAVTLNTGSLMRAQQQLHDMPEADMARVAEIKAAIQNNGIKPDIEALSAAMLEFHRK
ncbi:flagellar biosynthesis anti-sigma factor FlgM [Enterobacteriaceae bacterium LUAb1]